MIILKCPLREIDKSLTSTAPSYRNHLSEDHILIAREFVNEKEWIFDSGKIKYSQKKFI